MSCLPSGRWSSRSTTSPALRNASSRRRLARMSKLKSTAEKISGSALNVTLVPVRSVEPIGFRGADRTPAHVLLEPDLALAHDLELEPLTHRVDSAHADAVEPRRDLVARVVELP